MPISTEDFDSWRVGINGPVPRSVAQVDLSDMPMFARLRLQNHAKNKRAPFTSNMSIPDLLLTAKLGFRPIAQVTGTSVYHIGWQLLPNWGYSEMELPVQTHARMESWSLAVKRIDQQAKALGAHGVVGLHINKRATNARLSFSLDEKDKGGDVLDISLQGTAVNMEGWPQPELPFLSNLSGADFFKLRAADWFPIGIAYGACVIYQPSYWSAMNGSSAVVPYGTQFQSQELVNFTQGIQKARRLATERAQAQAHILGGTGVLGMDNTVHVQEVEREINDQKQVGIIVTAECIGTAVAYAPNMSVNPDLDYAVSLGASG